MSEILLQAFTKKGRSRFPTILKLTTWIRRTDPSTFGRERARAHQIGEAKYTATELVHILSMTEGDTKRPCRHYDLVNIRLVQNIAQVKIRTNSATQKPPWRQPMGKLMVSLVNTPSNATRIGWHLWETGLRFAHGLPPGWGYAVRIAWISSSSSLLLSSLELSDTKVNGP